MNLHTLANSTEFEHSRQVARISGLLAYKLGYSQSDVSIISQAAAYHDIGKVAVPSEILNKPGPLTPEEFEIVKTHTELGYAQLAEAAEILSVAAEMAHYHHERVDGHGGYHGLAGSAIHPFTKIVSVADVYDALASKRAYKSRWETSEVCAYFEDQSGRQFDTEVVTVLLSAIQDILLLYKEADSR